MSEAIRAVYENGLLRLLDPVHLAEGQTVEVVIVSEREQIRIALKDMLVKYTPDPSDDDDIDETAILNEIHAALQGIPPVSDVIIEERREGP